MTRFLLRHRWPVVLAWVALAAALVAGATARPGPADDDFAPPASESRRAAELLGGPPPEPPGTLVVAGADPERVRQALGELTTRLSAIESVRVAPGPTSQDGTVATASLGYPDPATALRIKETDLSTPGADADLAGSDFADFTPGGVTEGVGLLAAAAILLLAFRSLIAMALPLVVGVVGVICGVSLLSLLQNLVPAPSFAGYLTIMLGLGVGIDYALLVVTRFRTSLHDGLEVEPAIATAMRTAGRSVLYAGLTVILTGAGILFLGPEQGGGIALAAGCGVLMVMLAALTLLPALLRLVGNRIDRFGLPRRESRTPLAARWSAAVQRRPWGFGLIALGVLTVMALPALDLRVGWSDASNRPVTDTTRRAHDTLARAFGPGAEAPLVLVAAGGSRTPRSSGEGCAAELVAACRWAERTPGVARVTAAGERAALVIPATGAQDVRTTELLHRLRAELPENVLVTGSTAAAQDYAEHVRQRLPWTVGAVLLASFVLLTFVFRSVVVPLKAVAVNLLSVGAAYGVIVACFQWPPDRGGPIDAWVPTMLFVITFGLSMDYEVFLLSRIREAYLRTGDNSHAVREGLAATARVISAAAAIMVCVFAAFGAFDDRALRIMGVGLAAAVLVDATIVRLVLVPAAMQVLGERNWWFPARLSPRRLRTSRRVRRSQPRADDGPGPGFLA
ncbi:MMPL family transporter [Nonomuraea sp. NPDC050328]|uniref:MMPL family transporter n=1 Tax=Nonomuraea sp. NPDC050328 TaxID=3364361 RepID=UPI0037878E23